MIERKFLALLLLGFFSQSKIYTADTELAHMRRIIQHTRCWQILSARHIYPEPSGWISRFVDMYIVNLPTPHRGLAQIERRLNQPLSESFLSTIVRDLKTLLVIRQLDPGLSSKTSNIERNLLNKASALIGEVVMKKLPEDRLRIYEDQS